MRSDEHSAERECARAEGVGSAEGEARAAKRSQEAARGVSALVGVKEFPGNADRGERA